MIKYLFSITLLLAVTQLSYSQATHTQPEAQIQHKTEITEFFLHSKQSEKDVRFEYDRTVFELALAKTVKKYGPYKLSYWKKHVNLKRLEILIRDSALGNFFFKSSITHQRLQSFAYSAFPVDLGIVGYRVAFVTDAAEEKLKLVTSLEQLKYFKIVQGPGWLDTNILRHHDFNVLEGSTYKSLFSMISRQRGDLLPRGANEILAELEAHKNLSNFNFDTSIALFYPLPRFFLTNKKNGLNAKRIEEGLIIAFNDGSLQKLWNQHYRASLDFVQLNKRKIFKITNPFIKGIDKSYERYFYQPIVEIN